MASPRGFIALPLLGWVAVAAAVALAGMGLALKVQSGRLATAKADLAVCADRYALALASIEKQNKAVDALKSASDKALQRARIASEKARKGQVATLSEIERLKASKGVGEECPAAQGVNAVREGLKP